MKSVSIILLLAITLSTDAADRKSRARGAWAWATSSNAWTVTETGKTTTKEPLKLDKDFSDNALDEVNEARKARGLPPFKHDPQLTAAALACARERASRGIHGHLESDFVHLPAGVSTNGVAAGCAALEPSWGWQSCCWDDPQYTTAGAAWVMSGGLRYMHIFVSGQSPAVQSTPQVYQQSTTSAGTCADGSCGTATYSRRGIFRRR